MHAIVTIGHRLIYYQHEALHCRLKNKQTDPNLIQQFSLLAALMKSLLSLAGMYFFFFFWRMNFSSRAVSVFRTPKTLNAHKCCRAGDQAASVVVGRRVGAAFKCRSLVDVYIPECGR